MLNEDRQAQQAQRRATAVVAGVVALLALVIVGVVVFVVRGGGSESSSTRPPDIPGESRNGSGAEPAAGERSDQLTASDVRWSDFHGLPVPTSSAGPRTVQGGRASGFARTRAGAVLAAINISYRSESSAGPAVFVPTIEEQVVGPDKGKFLSKRQASYDVSRARYGVAADGSVTADYDKAKREQVRVWAYRMDSYDGSSASVQVLSRFVAVGGTAPSYVNFAVTVRWVDDDWRILAPFNGEWVTGATPLPDVPRDYTVISAQ